jgi:hypothetical protein
VAGPTRDPWDYWVFSISGSAFMNGQSRTSQGSYNASFSANRTTENWKISSYLSRNYSESRFDYGAETVTSIRKSASAMFSVVKSLGAHFAAGLSADATSSSYSNIDLGLRIAPAIGLDIFPYAESTRRIFTLHYTAGLTSYDYYELTVYDEVKETRPNHALDASYRITQPWGSLGFGMGLSQLQLRPVLPLRLEHQQRGESADARPRRIRRRGGGHRHHVLTSPRTGGSGWSEEPPTSGPPTGPGLPPDPGNEPAGPRVVSGRVAAPSRNRDPGAGRGNGIGSGTVKGGAGSGEGVVP